MVETCRGSVFAGVGEGLAFEGFGDFGGVAGVVSLVRCSLRWVRTSPILGEVKGQWMQP